MSQVIVWRNRVIKEGDPRYDQIQDLVKYNEARQEAAVRQLELIGQAQDVASTLTDLVIPDELRALGYRFAFAVDPEEVTGI